MPEIWGIEHILYLIVFVILSASALFIVNKYCKTEKTKEIAIKITGGVLLIFILFNRISLTVGRDWTSMIPDSFCGLTSLLLALSALCIKNKNHGVFHCLVYLAFLGPTLTMAYPDFIGQSDSIWYSRTISGLLHHSVALFLAVLLCVTGKFTPNLKKWWCLPLGLCAFMTFGLFLTQVLEFGNAMQINKPLIADSPFTWYFVGFLFVSVQIVFLLVYNKLSKRKLPNQTADDICCVMPE